MKIFFISMLVFAAAIVLMSVGVLIGKRRIKGSCGGLAGLEDREGRPICDICTRPSRECRGENAESD